MRDGFTVRSLTPKTDAIPGQLDVHRDQRDAPHQGPPAGLPVSRCLERAECRAGPLVAGQLHPLDPEQSTVSLYLTVEADCRTYQYQGGVRNPDGTTPRRSEYAGLTADASSDEAHDPALTAAETALTDFIGYDNKSRLAAGNLFQTHKQAIGPLRAHRAQAVIPVLISRGWADGLFGELFPPWAGSRMG